MGEEGRAKGKAGGQKGRRGGGPGGGVKVNQDWLQNIIRRRL